MISRAELAELYREDDRLRAEHAEWMAQREAQAQALVRQNSVSGTQDHRQHAAARSAPISYKGLKTDRFSEGMAMPSTLASTPRDKERGALAPVCPAIRTEPEFMIAAILGLSRLEARVRTADILIQNGSSRLLISQDFSPRSVTTGRSRGTLRNKGFSRASVTTAQGRRAREPALSGSMRSVDRSSADKPIPLRLARVSK